MKLIRNFSIIAHVDHGKSTLADRFIQLCGGLQDREMEAQVLDSMALERERGITIKAQSVSLKFRSRDGQTYQLNLIDTPGHVDFSYEVSRSLAACEGALLVVDAAQGVEAQSVANCYTAIEQGLEVVPVLNKIDLPSADPPRVINEIEEIIGIEAQDALRVSAKTGENVPELLEELIRRVPPPKGDPDAPLQALIIDSWFDNYVGVVSLVRVMNGSLRMGAKIRVWSTGRAHTVDKLGRFTPKSLASETLETGEVGFVIAGIKDINGAPVGDAYRRRGARDCVPIYNALDPTTHHPVAPDARFAADLAFLGNRLPDREARVDEFFLRPASLLPNRTFLLGGNGWQDRDVPANVRRLGHVRTLDHNALNCSATAVLNINRSSMARFGHSPATRVFEAAGAGACLVTDAFEGVESFLEPDCVVRVAASGDEVAACVASLTPARARAIGAAARARVLAAHTYDHRADLVEQAMGVASSGRGVRTC